MDETRFDTLTRVLGFQSRRDGMRLLAGGALAGLLARMDAPAVTATKRKKKRKK